MVAVRMLKGLRLAVPFASGLPVLDQLLGHDLRTECHGEGSTTLAACRAGCQRRGSVQGGREGCHTRLRLYCGSDL